MLSALHSALAPEVAPRLDFAHHWNMFLKYYAKQPLGHKSRPVESTNLVYHLNAMLKILVRETSQACFTDDNSDKKEIVLGPCMEYLINRQILDILSSLCQADVPPGIRPYIYKVFVFLVENLRIQQQGFLPHVNVYLPIRRLLMLSCVGKASPTESQEMNFLSALVFRMKTDPELLTLFAHDSRPGDVSHCSSRRSSNASTAADMAHIKKFLESTKSECEAQAMSSPREDLFEKFESQHLIVACLVNFLDSADYMIAYRAMELLLVVCQVRENSGAAENAVQNTPLCAALADRMTALFNAIPSDDVDPGSLEEICVNWMEEAHHLQQSQYHSTSSSKLSNLRCRSELVVFFCWLDFCDTLTKESVDIVSRAVAASLVDDFFVACIECELRDAVNRGYSGKIAFLLAFISQCWTHIRSDTLATEFSVWLIGNPADVSRLPGRLTHPLKHSLVTLCSSTDQDVCMEALRTFDVLLSIRPRDSVLQCLVLVYLMDRGYLDRSGAESSIASWSDEEDEREMRQKSGERMIETIAIDAQIPGEEACPEVVPTVSSRTLAPTNIGRIINKWLYLVPFNEFRPSMDGGNAAADSGYDQYVKNAEIQVREVFHQCRGYTEWPREAVFPLPPNDAICGDRDSSDSRAEEDASGSGVDRFYEGEFLEMLFDMVSTLLDRDYAQNLQMTAIVSRLAMFPHPYLHEFLLNPTLSTSSSARTLYSVVSSVVDRAKMETETIEDLPRKVSICRRTLACKGTSEGERLMFTITSRETRIIDGLIVLEEFGKELAAIALVKYHMAC